MRQKLKFVILFTLAASGIFYYYIHKSSVKLKSNFPFCTRLPRVPILEMAPNEHWKWKNHTTINVYFEQGINPLTNKIILVANRWSDYCGINFKIQKVSALAQVKVTFKEGGFASAIGTECTAYEYKTNYSMFLQGIDTIKDPAQFNRIILHEFGHVLGIEHEFSKPSAAIPWNKKEVYKYYKEKFKWKEREVDHNLFREIAVTNKDYQEFDKTSIMVYGIEPPLTIEPYKIEWPQGLSETDKRDIAKWYPK